MVCHATIVVKFSEEQIKVMDGSQHLTRKRPHDSEGGHIQRNSNSWLKFCLIDHVAATNDVPRSGRGLSLWEIIVGELTSIYFE